MYVGSMPSLPNPRGFILEMKPGDVLVADCRPYEKDDPGWESGGPYGRGFVVRDGVLVDIFFSEDGESYSDAYA